MSHSAICHLLCHPARPVPPHYPEAKNPQPPVNAAGRCLAWSGHGGVATAGSPLHDQLQSLLYFLTSEPNTALAGLGYQDCLLHPLHV